MGPPRPGRNRQTVHLTHRRRRWIAARASGVPGTHLFVRTALNERVMRPTLLMTTPRDFMEVRYAILICDDDPDVRMAMRRTLNRFHATEAASPAEALAVLRVARFDAVVSDFSLGTSADGLDLLQTVRVLWPDTVRFLVTGNTDVQVAIRALNEGAVHRYFLKPWDDDKLVSSLEIALRTRALRPVPAFGG
jgi:response regulator RpfG family c-di-GMP phosphodiesterase